MTEKCFACDRLLSLSPATVTCADEQVVQVGADCFAKIKTSGSAGWQPPKGGPRLYLLEHKPK